MNPGALIPTLPPRTRGDGPRRRRIQHILTIEGFGESVVRDGDLLDVVLEFDPDSGEYDLAVSIIMKEHMAP